MTALAQLETDNPASQFKQDETGTIWRKVSSGWIEYADRCGFLRTGFGRKTKTDEEMEVTK